PDHDLVYAATPPYRFSNPRYIDTGYGVDAAAALQWTPRRFSYFADPTDNRRAMDALSVLLWGGNYSEVQRQSAREALDAVRAYGGELWIEDGATAASSHPGSKEIIEWIQFRVRLCMPSD
ncbi:MAG: hypothetical protein R3282_00910, partial [Rhodothermales bacterium]|nr:hypothetical protein [Rhodothermales bacterium]